MKSITKYLAASIMVIAGSANAAMISIEGIVYTAENYDGLFASNPTTDIITADITFDDALTGIGVETLTFDAIDDPNNSILVTAGDYTFNQTNIITGSILSISFEDGYLIDFKFSTEYNQNGAAEEFISSLTTATADRTVQAGNGKNDVQLYAEWDNTTQFITPVPVPAAVWLFGSGLLGLAGIARRKTA